MVHIVKVWVVPEVGYVLQRPGAGAVNLDSDRFTLSAPANRHDSVTLAASERDPGHRRGVAGAVERPPRPRLRLQAHQRASGAPRPDRRDFGERQTCSAQSWDAVGRGEAQLLAQRPREACVVHRTRGAGHRFLASLLQRGHRCETAHTKSLDPLPLGGAASAQTMTYWRKLLGLRFKHEGFCDGLYVYRKTPRDRRFRRLRRSS